MLDGTTFGLSESGPAISPVVNTNQTDVHKVPMSWLDRHRVEIWLSLTVALLIVTVDPFKRGLMTILGLPVVIMMIVSHNTHSFTPLGILAGLSTLVVEVTCLVLAVHYLIKRFR